MTEITLNSDQQTVLQAILLWLENRTTAYISVGGYAGTGKTTLIAYFRNELATQVKWKNVNVAFCSYTGKAASVLRTKLQDANAMRPNDSCSTIHSLIYRPVLDDVGQISSWERAITLNYGLIVIDEGSMINAVIWQDLLRFNIPILVVGDHGQLPPIEGGFNLMQKPDLRLERIVRQAEDNPIIALSKQVREGKPIPYGTHGSVRKYSLQEYDSMDVFESLFTSKDDDYLCICGINRTRVGLNQKIRALKEFELPTPQRGDRVICLKNNHAKAIYNGMIGRLKEIAPEDHWYNVEVDFDGMRLPYSGKILKYQFNQQKTVKADTLGLPPGLSERQFGDLFDFGYALTCHKAQGSEAQRVVVFEERMRMYDDEMWRRWLYTAVTRAREELYIFA